MDSFDILVRFPLQAPNSIAVIAADLFKFSTAFYDVLIASTPHLYISALSWAPSDSLISKELASRFRTQPLIVSGREKLWRPFLWSSTVSARFYLVKLCPLDGNLVASSMREYGTMGGTLMLWNAQTGELDGEPFAKNDAGYLRIDFSPDGKYLAAQVYGGGLTFWSVSTRRQLLNKLEGAIQNVSAFDISPSKNEIVVAYYDNTFTTWSLHTEEQVFGPVSTEERISCLRYSPDGKHIISGLFDGQMKIWRIESDQVAGEQLTDGHTGYIWEVIFSPDGRFFCSASDDETLRLWSVKRRKVLYVATISIKAGGIEYTPDGRYIVTASEGGSICLMEVIGNDESASLVAHSLSGSYGAAGSVSCSSDGRFFLTGSWDGSIRAWDIHDTLASTRQQSVGTGHIGSDVNSVACSPDGTTILSVSTDGSLRFWSLETGVMVKKQILSAQCNAASYSPDGKSIVSAGGRNVYIWDVDKWEVVKTFSCGEDTKLYGAFYTYDARYIVALSYQEGRIYMWDDWSGEAYGNSGDAFEPESLLGIAFSPTTHRMVIMSKSDHIVYDIETKESVFTLAKTETDPDSIYSPDGKYIAHSEGSDIYIYDATTGEILSGPIKLDVDQIKGLVYSPNGKYLAVHSMDRKLLILALESKKIVAGPIFGHTELISDIDYSPDGRCIVTGSTDDTIRIWDVESLLKLSDHGLDRMVTVFEDATFEASSIRKPKDKNDVETSENTAVVRRILPRGVAEDGWYRSTNGALLLWVPHDYRMDAVDMSKICIPPTARRELNYDLEGLFRFEGTSWTDIYSGLFLSVPHSLNVADNSSRITSDSGQMSRHYHTYSTTVTVIIPDAIKILLPYAPKSYRTKSRDAETVISVQERLDPSH